MRKRFRLAPELPAGAVLTGLSPALCAYRAIDHLVATAHSLPAYGRANDQTGRTTVSTEDTARASAAPFSQLFEAQIPAHLGEHLIASGSSFLHHIQRLLQDRRGGVAGATAVARVLGLAMAAVIGLCFSGI
ncbi:hypothetical protein GCM10009741_41420 [Kribbella lupini]|uniref:Uncharacterized protein n=1 Tax=Kribbella lupini TaxID=291602 RepID=A0ABP4M0Y4_9ACTN